jgi:hypothetical protein
MAKPTERVSARLQRALERNHGLAQRLADPQFPLPVFDRLQQWQRARLARSYADLLGDPQFSAAGHFFLDELYGGLAFRERDQQVARVLPVMTRSLPNHMLHALAGAFELQALSLELDMEMAACLLAEGRPEVDMKAYHASYLATGRPDERKRQIELIRALGLELLEIVQQRSVLRLVRLLRLPARAAGFGLLQDFLEQGLRAFRQMQDGRRFVETVYQREWHFMERLFEGRPEPFSR